MHTCTPSLCCPFLALFHTHTHTHTHLHALPTQVREAAVLHCELRATPAATAAAASADPREAAGAPREVREWPFAHGRTFFETIKG